MNLKNTQVQVPIRPPAANLGAPTRLRARVRCVLLCVVYCCFVVCVASQSNRYRTWRAEFDTGGFIGCKDNARQPDRVRLVSPDWCAAALTGPGGRLGLDAAEHYAAHAHALVGLSLGGHPGGQQQPASAPEAAPASAPRTPLGHWCALPQRGHFPARTV